ncbi:uncharacterized protein LOC143057268 isoform X1 [Mytilus galloprovincialis]|uniref:uncharacterized protein LOC143057268 isoform X1 n=1 Tax=Mytilus galloprovincialis TaxID=29158 RepID=UPI003F7CA5B9
MCIMKSFQDFLQKNFRDSRASCVGEANLLINHNFTSCKGTQTTTESYPLYVTTEYSARTTESTTESRTATVSYRSSVTTTESTTGTQKTTESYPLSVTTEYSARTTESTTESQTATVSYRSSVTTTESTTGIINTDVIFISCGVCILFLLIAGLVCFCARKKSKKANINLNVITHGDRRADISPNLSTNRGSDAQYVEIEEIQMSNIIVSPLEQRNLIDGEISSDSSADGIQADEERRRTNTNVYQSLHRNRQDESRQYSSLTSIHIEQRNLTDGDISSDSSADGIQTDEESRRINTNVYQSLQRSSLNESRLYSSLKSVHLEEIVDEPI